MVVVVGGVLVQVEGGVVIAPLVFNRALVVTRVTFAGILKHKVMDATQGQQTKTTKKR